ncbi:endoplasmic reticulum-golgi intermediate compartment protein [Anaeramoeba flamelloides]|uniref:Endoplasmic reticulum-golgi intermediate compartment protein n=1 Tax=Anaeramoeba flamelloides TaxID=1746091 RepID=A0ABQ8Z9T3_9EUKA|nr:endoplasmic reticulum-golgi intermediate compartment protein [Anaeramoeba flamelloides]
MKSLIKFDAYPKTNDDYKIKTVSGAFITVISILIILLLFLNELSLYLSPHLHQYLIVDLSTGGSVDININITMPNISCNKLTLKSKDLSGSSDLEVTMISLDKNMQKISSNNIHSFANLNKNNYNDDDNNNQEGYCGNCYGANSLRDDGCCNSCLDVREAYEAEGLDFEAYSSEFEQCKNENTGKLLNDPHSNKIEVGCQVIGHAKVNKFKGRFKLIPFFNENDFLPNQDLNQLNSQINNLNLTHNIGMISFGDIFPGASTPLSNVFVRQDQPGKRVYQYYIKIVPTIIYRSQKLPPIETAQYSVYEYTHKIRNSEENEKPGVFFFYDFSPIMVEIYPFKKSFFHFITQLFGLTGGIYSIASIIDHLIFRFFVGKNYYN